MKPHEALIALKSCFERGENIALVGPPGVGKSSLGAQAAAMVGHDFIVSLPALEDMTEPGGIPWFAEDHSHAQKLLFGQAYKAVTSTRPTVWAWEDFGQAMPSVQAGYMQWAEAREVNGYRLPDHVKIMMMTNRRTDKAGVSGVLEPVKGRFTMINVDSDLDDFCKNLFDRGQSHYGLSEEQILAGSTFLRTMPDELNKFEPTADMTNSPTERNWVHAFGHTFLGLPGHIESALVAGRVGVGAAAAFMGYLRTYRSTISLDAILADPDNAIIPENPSALWCVSIGLANKATVGNFTRVCTYGKRLHEKNFGEFTVLMVRDSLRRTPKISDTRAYQELMAGPIGDLITGKVD